MLAFYLYITYAYCYSLLYTNIDQTLMNSLHRRLNCKIGGVESHVITTEYRSRVHCIHMYHLFCNALVRVIYSGVSGQCSSHTIRGGYVYMYIIVRVLVVSIILNTVNVPGTCLYHLNHKH